MQQQQLQQPQAAGMNQMLEIFKMQYLMKFMNDTSGKGSIWTMVALMFYDQFARAAPVWFGLLLAYFTQKNQKPIKQLELMATSTPPPSTKSVRTCIQFERQAEAKTVDPRIDAVMYHVCNLPDVRSLRYNGLEMIPNFKDIIMIENDVWFEILNPQTTPIAGANKEMKLEPILYRLLTYYHDITWLHKFVEESMERYEQEKKNKLGSETYYFDQVTSSGGAYRNPISNQVCMFNKSKFQSNRSLSNVYLRQIDELKQRVEFFIRRRDWYDSKGIPHTLGIVMYGHPGCGKTSTIKAIANETKRHIFNIALSEIKTKEALKELFYNDVVHNFVDGKLEVLNIPIKQRVYVIEDIDAMDSVVIKRTAEQVKKEEEKKLKLDAEVELLKQTQGVDAANRMLNGKGKDSADSLDLATLLNVLDGVRETPGRIIILSTNYPERLDEALLRPGRFDMMIEFEKHSRTVLKQHIKKYYGTELTSQQSQRLDNESLHFKWTPAEVGQILFRRIQNIDLAIDDLVNEDPAKLFKFSQLKKPESIPPEEKGTSIQSLLEIAESDDSVLKKKFNITPPPEILPIQSKDFISEIDAEFAQTTAYLLESSNELRTHSLTEYKTYLQTLKATLLEGSISEEILTQNWLVFKSARDSMKAPKHEVISEDSDDDGIFLGGFSGGMSMGIDGPSKEQELAGKLANDKVNAHFENKGELVSIPTFDSDSTEIAKQYIGAIHSFEEAQDSFFEGFLTNTEPKALDDYFQETLV
jgi:DNA polymerase III delta prime subunit